MMSLLVSDVYIHPVITKITDFNFLIEDIRTLVHYKDIYEEEQDLLMYAIRIYGELARTAQIA